MKRRGFAFMELLIVLAVLILLGSVVIALGYHFLVSPLGWRGWLVGTCAPAGLFIVFLAVSIGWFDAAKRMRRRKSKDLST